MLFTNFGINTVVNFDWEEHLKVSSETNDTINEVGSISAAGVSLLVAVFSTLDHLKTNKVAPLSDIQDSPQSLIFSRISIMVLYNDALTNFASNLDWQKHFGYSETTTKRINEVAGIMNAVGSLVLGITNYLDYKEAEKYSRYIPVALEEIVVVNPLGFD